MHIKRVIHNIICIMLYIYWIVIFVPPAAVTRRRGTGTRRVERTENAVACARWSLAGTLIIFRYFSDALGSIKEINAELLCRSSEVLRRVDRRINHSTSRAQARVSHMHVCTLYSGVRACACVGPWWSGGSGGEERNRTLRGESVPRNAGGRR